MKLATLVPDSAIISTLSTTAAGVIIHPGPVAIDPNVDLILKAVVSLI